MQHLSGCSSVYFVCIWKQNKSLFNKTTEPCLGCTELPPGHHGGDVSLKSKPAPTLDSESQSNDSGS